MHQENEFNINQCRSCLLGAVSHEEVGSVWILFPAACGSSRVPHVYREYRESHQNRWERRKTLRSLPI